MTPDQLIQVTLRVAQELALTDANGGNGDTQGLYGDDHEAYWLRVQDSARTGWLKKACELVDIIRAYDASWQSWQTR